MIIKQKELLNCEKAINYWDANGFGQMSRGVDMGPSAIRYAGIYEKLNTLFDEIEDLGDIPIGRPEVVIDPNQI